MRPKTDRQVRRPDDWRSGFALNNALTGLEGLHFGTYRSIRWNPRLRSIDPTMSSPSVLTVVGCPGIRKFSFTSAEIPASPA